MLSNYRDIMLFHWATTAPPHQELTTMLGFLSHLCWVWKVTDLAESQTDTEQGKTQNDAVF